MNCQTRLGEAVGMPSRRKAPFQDDMQPEFSQIYIVSSGGYLKLGVTRNVDRRLRALQVSMPHPVTLEALWDVPASRAFRTEAYAHRMLERFRVRGEWFSATMSDVRAVEPMIYGMAYGHEATTDSEGAADQYASGIIAGRRWLTLEEQATYFAMINDEP